MYISWKTLFKSYLGLFFSSDFCIILKYLIHLVLNINISETPWDSTLHYIEDLKNFEDFELNRFRDWILLIFPQQGLCVLDLLLLKWNFLTSKQVTRKFDVTQCLSVVFCLYLLLSHESGWPFVKYLPSQILTQQNFFFPSTNLKKKFFSAFVFISFFELFCFVFNFPKLLSYIHNFCWNCWLNCG